MSKKFYISDLHFGHKNVLTYDNRPWHSVEDMEQALISNWNSVVGAGDLVYVLGDMFWCNDSESLRILDQLNGQIILIKGNHDRHGGEYLNRFAKVTDYLETDDEGRKVVLCHYPIPCFNRHYYGAYHLYGHVHTGFEANMMENIKQQMIDLYTVPCNMFNVGCMTRLIDYIPRTLDEIIARSEVSAIN